MCREQCLQINHVKTDTEIRSRQVDVGTKTGAEFASLVFRCLMKNPQPQKRTFEN